MTISSGISPQTNATATEARSGPSSQSRVHDVDNRVTRISDILHSLEGASAESGLCEPRQAGDHQQRLVDARLGVASSLFTALRLRHAPTADHCLRVALGCSAWSAALDMPPAYRVALEIAALLHDVGKIGVPDAILLKPGMLSADEAAVMARHRRMGVDILSSCCATPEVLEIVRYASAWYDGSRHGLACQGNDIPFGARMLAIVDAYDAMITDHIYRPARSRDRAMAELFEFGGSQFDPKLVRSFHDLFAADSDALLKNVTGTWLKAIAGQQSEVEWGLAEPSRIADEADDVMRHFEAKLIDNMHDGVVFVDQTLRMFVWNSGAERLTGIAASAVRGRSWMPALLELRSERGKPIAEDECPVRQSLQSGAQSLARVSIAGRSGRDIPINLHAIPVHASDGTLFGATVLLQDASPEAHLEERCQSLQEQAAKDPLTQIANRAEFDRMHALFIDVHIESGLPCSLIITDLDHFKHVNDVYGHQAGDAALRSYAALLKSMCRAGDVVARYGGEEFVILCADCNNRSAARRAEQIRRRLAETSQPDVGNRALTASFGVTELQAGDTPETMLRRADRALLQAKDQGRNQVVQLGDVMMEKEPKKSWWPFPFRTARQGSLIDCQLITNVPIEVAAQKLRGFIADHSARITSTGEDHLFLDVSGERAGRFRRSDDRPLPFLIELHFSEERVERRFGQGPATGEYLQTRAHVTIRPKKERDRRREQAAERARHLLLSMKSYLMAKEETENDRAPSAQGHRVRQAQGAVPSESESSL